MTSDRRVLRPWALALVLALLATALVVLRPTGTTLAAWSDEVTVEIPAMATGGIGMDVTPAAGASARVAVTGDVAGSWRPAGVRVSVDGQPLTGAQLAGSRVEYRLAAESGQCPTTGAARYSAELTGDASTFPVTGGERVSGPQTLCLTFVPSDKVRVDHGGRALSLTTELDGAAPAATWTAAGSWAASHQMAAAPVVDGLRCDRAGWLDSRGMISWDWLNGDGLSITHWEIQRQAGSSWPTVGTAAAGDRSWHASNGTYPREFLGHVQNLRVVAVLSDGTTTVASGSTTSVRVVDFLGLRFNVRCA